MLAGAGLAFLWFAYHLRGRLRAAEGVSDGLSGLGFASAVLFVMLLFAFGGTQGPTNSASSDSYDEPETRLTRIIPHQGYSMLAYGFVAAALWVAATAVTMQTTGMFSAWLWRAGLVVDVLLLPGLLFVPIFLSAIALVVWILALSVVLSRDARTPIETPS